TAGPVPLRNTTRVLPPWVKSVVSKSSMGSSAMAGRYCDAAVSVCDPDRFLGKEAVTCEPGLAREPRLAPPVNVERRLVRVQRRADRRRILRGHRRSASSPTASAGGGHPLGRRVVPGVH